jgi:hypothetical protein
MCYIRNNGFSQCSAIYLRTYFSGRFHCKPWNIRRRVCPVFVHIVFLSILTLHSRLQDQESLSYSTSPYLFNTTFEKSIDQRPLNFPGKSCSIQFVRSMVLSKSGLCKKSVSVGFWYEIIKEMIRNCQRNIYRTIIQAQHSPLLHLHR